MYFTSGLACCHGKNIFPETVETTSKNCCKMVVANQVCSKYHWCRNFSLSTRLRSKIIIFNLDCTYTVQFEYTILVFME